ncbi:hypothetical protein B0J14DRAFT_672071, partial [Halenospora varia]
ATPIKCVNTACHQQHLIENGAFDHPVVILHVYKCPESAQSMALVLCSSSNPQPDPTKPLNSLPVANQAQGDEQLYDNYQPQDLLFIERQVPTKKQSYVLLHHVYAVSFNHMSQFWHKDRSDFRLEKESDARIMTKLQITPAKWVETTFFQQGDQVDLDTALPAGIPALKLSDITATTKTELDTKFRTGVSALKSSTGDQPTIGGRKPVHKLPLRNLDRKMFQYAPHKPPPLGSTSASTQQCQHAPQNGTHLLHLGGTSSSTVPIMTPTMPTIHINIDGNNAQSLQLSWTLPAKSTTIVLGRLLSRLQSSSKVSPGPLAKTIVNKTYHQ